MVDPLPSTLDQPQTNEDLPLSPRNQPPRSPVTQSLNPKIPIKLPKSTQLPLPQLQRFHLIRKRRPDHVSIKQAVLRIRELAAIFLPEPPVSLRHPLFLQKLLRNPPALPPRR